MNLRNSLLAISSLVLIWAAVAAVMQATESRTSTPQKVLGLMSTAPWLNGDTSEAARKKRIEEVVANVNRLDFDQRNAMRGEGDRDTGRRFFESLTKDEQHQYIQDTVEQHFKSVMKAFNKMSREERQHLVNQSLRDMERNPEGDGNMARLQQEDKAAFNAIVEKGLGAYYQDASSATKLDLEPLMEKMQQRLRNFH